MQHLQPLMHWPPFHLHIVLFQYTIYVLTPDREIRERWRWIAVVSLSGSIWLMVIAAYTAPEGGLSIVSFILIFLGVVVGTHGKYRQWANPPAHQ